MTDIPIRTGDLVKLRSGGRVMTVLRGESDDRDDVAVIWLDNDGVPHNLNAPSCCLVLVEDRFNGR